MLGMARRLMLSILLAAVGCVAAAPAPTARPLSDSPGDLAWDAWIRQGEQPDQVIPPRRITTKSLFVFPNLGAEALPACPEGYRQDSMGRCVKEVKLDETAHLEFLLQKLNSQFATESQDEVYDYDLEPDTPESSGPIQFNIPLALSGPSVSKNDESIPGDYVVVAKKDLPKQPSPIPTSAPEVVPEYNDQKQFFLGSSPGPTESILQQNTSDVSGGVSILLRNSTSPGITLLIPSNGHIKNISNSFNGKSNETKVTVESESVKTDREANKVVGDSEKETNDNRKESAAVTEISLEVTILDSNYPNSVKENKDMIITAHGLSNHEVIPLIQSPNITDSKVIKSDSLVDQIEALKDSIKNYNESDTKVKSEILTDLPPETSKKENVSNTLTSYKEHSSIEMTDCSDCKDKTKTEIKPNDDHKTNNIHDRTTPEPIVKNNQNVANPQDIDIEEKIKIISLLADVSRNTENRVPDTQIITKKKTPSDFVRFPSIMFADGNVEIDDIKQPDLSPAPSSLIRFPSDRNPLPHNSIYGIQSPPSEYPKFQPLPMYDKDVRIQESQEKPVWLPFGWNINNNPPGEYNLMDFWSRMPSMQRYPYSGRIQNRHPPQYHTLYPNSHGSSGRLNARHTQINYRQGRDDMFNRQVYPDRPVSYKRSRHPHFRDSEDLSRVLGSYNGR